MKRKKRKQEGMVTVDTVLSLFPFILMIMGIISFINIFMVHNKIQFAMYQAGSELASYSYLYHALGVRAADIELGNDIEKETTEIRQTMEDTSTFLDTLEGLEDSVDAVGSGSWDALDDELADVYSKGGDAVAAAKKAMQSGQQLISDPKDLMRNLVFFGVDLVEDEFKSLLLSQAAGLLVPRYLESQFPEGDPNYESADAYLRRVGVTDGVAGLDFSESQLFTRESGYRMIDIVVSYDIDIYYFKLFIKEPTITVVQRCTVPAWLDGDAGADGGGGSEEDSEGDDTNTEDGSESGE